MSVVADEYNKIKQTVDALKPDVDKFEKGNAAAGTRIREAMQNIKVSTQKVRKDVQEIKNANKAK